MAWSEGNQNRRAKGDINQEILNLEGFLDENEAKQNLYKFLKDNITFTTSLIGGVDLFPFQHMAIKAMFETDYFMGVWSRGMSKSFTTGVYAFLDAIMQQGVEIGILAASFRQSKQIFKKIEDANDNYLTILPVPRRFIREDSFQTGKTLIRFGNGEGKEIKDNLF